jgi:hypothetical protein
MFLPGFFLGAPAISFYLAVAWAGVTAAIHATWCISEVLRATRAQTIRSTD